jgi:hypothetical protein
VQRTDIPLPEGERPLKREGAVAIGEGFVRGEEVRKERWRETEKKGRWAFNRLMWQHQGI